jgi:hypothetical protein
LASVNTKRDESSSSNETFNSKSRLIFGWGINDAPHDVQEYKKVGQNKWKRVWVCPYYVKWYSILRRAKSNLYKNNQPTYREVSVSDDWQYLSNFIKWVDSQPNRDWETCEPDKDILFVGNKHYSRNTVVMVSRIVNSFTKDRGNDRGDCMLGVYRKIKGKSVRYKASCSDPFKQSSYHLGYFDTELEAHKAWQAKKHEYACQLAELQEDSRVADALRQRYAPDKDWTNE